jgi:hypothetical protein
MQIDVQKIERNKYEVLINEKLIGHFIRDVDGYLYYWPLESLSGSWNSNALRLIANKLDEFNKEWDLQIKTYFENEY